MYFHLRTSYEQNYSPKRFRKQYEKLHFLIIFFLFRLLRVFTVSFVANLYPQRPVLSILLKMMMLNF